MGLKSPKLIFLLGLLSVVTSFTSTFISAPRYELLLIISIIGAVISLSCVSYLCYAEHRLPPARLAIGVLAIWIISDSFFRYFAGIRIMNLLN